MKKVLYNVESTGECILIPRLEFLYCCSASQLVQLLSIRDRIFPYLGLILDYIRKCLKVCNLL